MDRIDLPSVLILIWDLKRAIETQKSIQIGLQQFNQRQIGDSFCKIVSRLISLPTADAHQVLQQQKLNVYQRSVCGLVLKGLSGIGVYQPLQALEKEILEICADDIERHAQLLPLVLQAPLLGCIFPALMMILLIPVANMLSA